MSPQWTPIEPLLSRSPSVLPQALSAGAAAYPTVRLAFHAAGGTQEATLDELHQYARRVAAGLVAVGVQAGDVVAVQLPSRIEATVAQAAVLLCGAVLLPLLPAAGPAETRFVLRESDATALIAPAWRAHDLLRTRGTREELPRLRQVVAVTGIWPAAEVPGDAVDWFTMDDFRPLADDARAQPGDVCLLAYTSGTGGPPKGVRHTHRSLLAELHTLPTTRRANRGRVHLDPSPPGRVAGLCAGLRAMVHGTPTVFMERWNAETALDLVHRHSVTSSAGTPVQLAGLLDAAERTGLGTGPLTDYLVAGPNAQAALVERADRAGVTACRAYGSTEHPTVTACLPGDTLAKRAGTDGRPMPGNEVRVVDAEGRVLPTGQDGEIQTRGPDLFAGYRFALLDAPALTLDGWLRTGDLGYLDTEGFLTVTSRARRAATGEKEPVGTSGVLVRNFRGAAA